ncbi:hypothetical protein [Streptomyces endophytica]|uniref:ATP-binding protein n=1 Tax=Streptomyces endophytica TaxID=2991496 RepID=A0ABY6P7T8_9ACTN|nr:hypothetical protein [Streptomyces endophytica]UZJ29873.1 hypothetical protein OJ254_04745 [Streptomyces endophytica]
MKQGTIKTLGVAALGAAFAVTAAGAASAAPAGAADAAGGLLHRATDTVSGATKSVNSGTNAKPGNNDIKTPLNSKGNKLLGGLPTGAVSKALPLG